MSEVAQLRWFAWVMCFMALAARKDVSWGFLKIAFVVWLGLGVLVHFAWWITKPKSRKP